MGNSRIALDNNGCYLQEQDSNNLWQIIGKDGTQLEFYSYDWIHGSETPFVWFGKDRILASKDGKFGFVSINGNITIPLKYNEIETREDGLFNVRIDRAWGLLHLDGFEVVNIKYSERLPLDYSDAIVVDANTGKMGMLNNQGIEKIPSIYDNLFFSINKKYIFFGYGTGISEYVDTNLGSFRNEVMWGCMNIDGFELIEPKYSCFILYDGFLLAGRNHSNPLVTSNSTNCLRIKKLHDYQGIFDLYDDSHRLIIGGFNDFEYDKKHSVFLFQFGGFWKYEVGGEDGWGDYHPSYYSYDDSNCKWLVLRDDLSCVLKSDNQKWGTIPSGFIVVPKRKEEQILRPEICTRFGLNRHDVMISYEWNVPMDILTKDPPKIIENIAICEDNHEKYAVRLEDGTKSQKYSDIHVISKDFFFVLKKQLPGQSNFIGISTFDKENYRHNYVENVLLYCPTNIIYLFTYPVHGYFFCAKRIDENKSSVLLYNLSNLGTSPIVAITSVDNNVLSTAIENGKLRLCISEYHAKKEGELYGMEPKESIGVSDIRLYCNDIFDDNFIKLTDEQLCNGLSDEKEQYWFSDETINIKGDNITYLSNHKHQDLFDFHSPFDNPYYNDALDMDQQLPDFWENL